MAKQPDTLSTVLADAAESGAGSRLCADGAARLIAIRHEQDGQVYVVGFRLVPAGEHAGEWHMAEFATRTVDDQPARGMTGKTVRELPIGQLLTQARNLAGQSRATRPPGQPFAFARPDELALDAFLTEGRGKRRRDDFAFAELALTYAFLVEEGDTTPAKTLAARHGGSAGTWANRIAEARRRGMLTPVRPGEAGGTLTDKAMQLLTANDPTDDEIDYLNEHAAQRAAQQTQPTL
ncbi:hypothetical protein [Longispora urticae]